MSEYTIEVTEQNLEIDITSPGVVNFNELVDVPKSYEGQANKILQVKSTEDGLEFTDSPTVVDWGEIKGDLSDQIDLQAALDLKYDSLDFDTDFDTRLATKDITDLNTYSHTSLTDIGTNTHLQIDSHIADNSIHFSDLSSFTTDNLTEGLNLYYTEARVSANTDVAANTLDRHNHNNKANLDEINQGLATTDSVSFVNVTSNLTGDVTGNVTGTLNGIDNTKISKLYQPDETNAFVYTDNGGTLHIDGDITQSGSSYETHAEQLYTTKDFIKTRDGAIAGLSAGEISGIEVLKYDGLNNLTFGTDSNGYFKVGEPGDLQTLSTREDNPTDGGITYFNDTLKRLDTNSTFVYNGGNVGIGTTSPFNLLTVKDSSTNYPFKIIGNVANSQGDDIAVLQIGSTSFSDNNNAAQIAAYRSGADHDNLGLKFRVHKDNNYEVAPIDAMTIEHTGNVGIGTTSPSQKLDVAGNINIDGTSTYLYDGVQGLKLAKGTDTYYANIFVGQNAGNSSATRQTAIGFQAGQSNTGTYQTALGYLAGRENTGSSQTAVGYAAGQSNTGSSQTAVGYAAGQSNTGNYQTAVGYLAGQLNTGVSQTAFGMYAGYQNTGNYQTAVGMYAGRENTGHRVTGIGYEATRGNLVDDVVAIGYQAGKDNNVANQFIVKQANLNSIPLIQGDFATGNVGINDTAPAEKLDVDGNINLTGVLKIDDVQILKEQQAHIEDLKTDYTAGDLDTEAEIISAINTTNSKINAILAMLETHGLVASS